jgi:Domain of unknown function (DUF4157)
MSRSSWTPERTGLLQRTCMCGTHALAGECTECGKKNWSLQRSAVSNNQLTAEVAPIVHDVLRSPGQPLDAATRAFFEPPMRHDFSTVRVHTDAKAAESAQAVNALAYTVGRDIVFASGTYGTGTSHGRRLLAHELVHTVQQNGREQRDVPQFLAVGAPGDIYEKDAESIAEHLAEGNAAFVNEKDTIPVLAGTLRLQRTCREHSGEAFYKTARNYCKDTGFSGALHPGQRCYREVPRRSHYFQCPPGDQVCFDAEGGCHDSFDRASPVEKKNADGTCNLHGLCAATAHALLDVVPGVFEEGAQEQARQLVECLESCDTLQGASTELCRMQCHKDSRLLP